MATTTRMTVEEYDRFTEDDERWTELVGGELVVHDPNAPHARVQAILLARLYEWERRRPGHARVYGVTEVRLTDIDSYAPDTVVTVPDPSLTVRRTLADPPMVVAEIRSPSTWRHDVGRKKAVYESSGVPELWLLDGIAGVVLVFRRSSPSAPVFDVSLELAGHEALTSPLLPGFSVSLVELFEPEG